MTEEQQAQVQSPKKPIWGNWWFWLIIILVIIIIILAGGNKNGEITPETITPTQEESEDDFLIEAGPSTEKETKEPVSGQEAQVTLPDSGDESTAQEPDEQDECSTDEECETGYECVAGICQLIACQPDCAGKECGDDGCGGICGVCDDGNPCSKNLCTESGLCIAENKPNEMPCGEGMWCINGDCVISISDI